MNVPAILAADSEVAIRVKYGLLVLEHFWKCGTFMFQDGFKLKVHVILSEEFLVFLIALFPLTSFNCGSVFNIYGIFKIKSIVKTSFTLRESSSCIVLMIMRNNHKSYAHMF